MTLPLTPRNPEILELIRQVCAPVNIITFVGSEKSCGKTTAFKVFLSAHAHLCNGVTSIGSDHAPAPETASHIFIQAGDVAATARQTLAASDVTREILATSGLQTPLGEVVLFRAKSAGHVLLAGASIIQDAIAISRQMQAWGAQKVWIDGALDRKSSAMPALADGVIFCIKLTATAPGNLPAKTAAQLRTLRTPALEASPALLEGLQKTAPALTTVLVDAEGVLHPFEKFDGEMLAAWVKQNNVAIDTIFFNGAVTPTAIAPLLNAGHNLRQLFSGARLTARDATRFFLTAQHLQQLAGLELHLRVLAATTLIALCLHPGTHSPEMAQQTAQHLAQTHHLPVMDVIGGVYAA